jgi:hypothetical protein
VIGCTVLSMKLLKILQNTPKYFKNIAKDIRINTKPIDNLFEETTENKSGNKVEDYLD